MVTGSLTPSWHPFPVCLRAGGLHPPHREELDTQYMRALFQIGYDMAARDYPWKKTPPGY